MEQKNPKIRHSALSNSYEDDGLKDVDVFTIVINLQCSWIERLYDENFHEWKIIPSYIIKKIFRENFIFHPCFEPSTSSLKTVSNFYEEMITNWAKSLSCSLTYHQQFFPSFYGLT